MTLRHVEDQLPLWVEGDLGAEEAVAVEIHLAACAACREAAEALRESQAWLRSDAAPFNAEDREDLRRAVLARVQGPARGAWWGAGIAALAAAALLIFFVRPHPVEAVASLPAPPAPAPAPVAPPERVVRVARRHPVRPPLEPSAGPGASRIEIQTDNPQIRIIWLARADAPQDPLHPTQEEP